MPTHRQTVQELLDYGGDGGNRRLTEWEIDLCESLAQQLEDEHRLTRTQEAKLQEIWGAIFR